MENKIIPIEHDGQRILTTAQLAEAYGTDTQNISKNFTRNQDRYKVGNHYFAFEGQEKRDFLNHVQIDGGLKNAQVIYLWTEKGAWLHAKSLNTDRAWEAYETLVDEYYRALDFIKSQPLNISRKHLPTWDRTTIGYIRVAREFSKASGVRVERAIAVALAKAQVETGVYLDDFRKLLPTVKEEDAEVLTAGQIGEQFSMKASAVNLLLEEMGLQFGLREAGKKPGTERLKKRNPWNLTEEGKKYGIMQDASKQSEKGQWQGFQILWSPKVIDLVRDYLAQKAAKEQGVSKE